jgi:hypothetical protein
LRRVLSSSRANAASVPSSRSLPRRRFELAPRLFDCIVAERVHDFGAVEQTALLFTREPVLHVAIAEDLREAAPARVFADDVRGDAVLRARPSKQECEGAAQQARESLHHGDCILAS